MFLCQIWQPYHLTTRKVDLDIDFKDETKQTVDTEVALYLDGFAYCGIMNIQDITQKWPATAGHEYKEHKIMEAFKKQSLVG